MSAVPGEVLRDVLLPLDRRTLDDVQFTSRRFLQLILERMSDVCLRKIRTASFWAPKGSHNAYGSSYAIHIDGIRDRNVSNAHVGTARLFSQFVQALRSSQVVGLSLSDLVFTPQLAALVLQTPIVARELSLGTSNCAQLTPTQFLKVILHFSPTSLYLSSCYLRACQVTDEVIRALSKNRVHPWFPRTALVGGGSFHVTDDAVVELCMQQDEEGDEPFVDLDLHNGSFTKDLFKRLVEASSVSMRTQPIRIRVSPSPVYDEDLRDFAQHLSYRRRGEPWQQRIYDFPAEQHGAVAAMHLQIVLHSDNRFEVLRARRRHIFFYDSDA